MTLDKLLLQVRRIAEHRELGAEKKIRTAYKQCLKELKQFIGYEYAALAENGKLTYDILAKKQEQTRFLEEVQQHIDRVAPEIRDEMTQLVSSVYNLSYNGMIEAAVSSVPNEVSSALKGLSYVQPMQVKSGVDNTLINKIMLNDVLEKKRKGVIYDLKQAINIGITNGETVDMVAKRISKTLDGDYKKSVRVARTEVHRVREAGLNEGAKDFDMQLQEADTGMRMAKIWHTMKDNRVRPNVVRKSKKGTVTKMGHGANHIQMEGQTVLADEQFELSDGNMTDAPGQSGIASQDINCRCFVRYKLVTEEEYMQLTGKSFEGKMFTNTDDGDIIKSGGAEMLRVKKASDYIEAMPKKQLRRIEKTFKKNGGIILRGNDVDKYLKQRQAEAITLNANTIILRQNPGRASVFEELIHTAQFKNGKNDGSYLSRLNCEIEAQEKLLRYAKAYNLTKNEIKQTRIALKNYKKELRNYKAK